MSSIAGVAEENSASTEEMSAAAEEMSAQVEEVTAATHELGRMADELDAQVAQFKLAGDESGDRSLRAVSESASSTPTEEERAAA
jgi:methyl-accepting chemotaxis protein